MTVIEERLAERISASLEQLQGSPPIAADTLASRVAKTIQRYADGLIEQTDVRLLVLGDPALAERWSFLYGEGSTRSPSTEDALALSVLERLDTVDARRTNDWPLDVAIGHVVDALKRVSDDVDAHRVAWLIENSRSGVTPESERTAMVGTLLMPLGAQVGTLPASLFPSPSAAPDVARNAVKRWTPLGVALVLHTERRVRNESALYAARRALARIRTLYGDELNDHVRDALEREKATDRDVALPELASAMREALRKFGAMVGVNDPNSWPATEEAALVTEGGIITIDAKFASFLTTFGEFGARDASLIRAAGVKRFGEHREGKVSTASLWEKWDRDRAVMLACVLWKSTVGQRLEDSRRKPAALTRCVSVEVLDLYSRRYASERRDGQQALVFPEQRGWVVVPSLSDATLSSILHRGVDMLASETGIDLLEWQVTSAHEQYTSRSPDYRQLAVDGGWSALAHEHLGISSKRGPENVRAIVHAQAHLQFDAYGIRGNLLAYAEPRKHAPGQRSLVTITLGDMLLQGFSFTIREEHGASSLASREAQRLVPILGKTALVGRNNDYAAQRRMVWRFAVLLRDSAEELAEQGAVRVPLDTWATLASEAGAPRSGEFLANVLSAWEKGDDKTPPLIERKSDQVTLHESRKDALAFIIQGGRRSIKKQIGGKRSARLRAADGQKRRKT